MARSFKKTPGWTNSGTDSRRTEKRLANIAVRNFRGRVTDPDDGARDIPDGKAYRKIYCSWNICDHKCVYYTKDQYRKYVAELWADFEKNRERGSRMWWSQKNEKEVAALAVRPLYK